MEPQKNVRLSEELLAKVVNAAREENKTPDELVEEAAELYLENRRWQKLLEVGQQRARDLGLVNWVAPEAGLDAETEKLARRLADGPTVALGIAKRLIRSSFDHSWDEHSHREAEGFAVASATADHREGVAAFVEKRKANFTGQ